METAGLTHEIAPVEQFRPKSASRVMKNPCRCPQVNADVFYIQRQCEGLANTLSRLAKGTTSRRKTLQAKTGRAGQRGPDDELATQLALARKAETKARELARDI